MTFQQIEPPVHFFDPISGRSTEFFARQGDQVHVLNGNSGGATQIELSEAKALVGRSSIRLTPDQARILEVESHE